jgi:hypothetical protein
VAGPAGGRQREREAGASAGAGGASGKPAASA